MSFSSPLFSSSSPGLSLSEEVVRLRIEVQGLRKENEQLRAVQAKSQQRLISPETWPVRIENEDDDGNGIARGYTPSEIILALKREFQVSYNDDEAIAVLREEGFDPEDVRAVVDLRGLHEEFFPMEYFCLKGDLMMCRWLYANGAAEDISRADEEDGITPMMLACYKGHLPGRRRAACRAGPGALLSFERVKPSS